MDNEPTLDRFANQCLDNRCNCITLNYDDMLDQALFKVRPFEQQLHQQHDPNFPRPWTPTGGYGFYCKSSQSIIADTLSDIGILAMHVLKLHGSVNWITKLGSPDRRPVDSVLHHSDWFRDIWWHSRAEGVF